LAERQPSKLNVVGSNPISRSGSKPNPTFWHDDHDDYDDYEHDDYDTTIAQVAQW
jgi:hypothetical protein